METVGAEVISGFIRVCSEFSAKKNLTFFYSDTRRIDNRIVKKKITEKAEQFHETFEQYLLLHLKARVHLQ
jgi:hypothetical protein